MRNYSISFGSLKKKIKTRWYYILHILYSRHLRKFLGLHIFHFVCTGPQPCFSSQMLVNNGPTFVGTVRKKHKGWDGWDRRLWRRVYIMGPLWLEGCIQYNYQLLCIIGVYAGRYTMAIWYSPPSHGLNKPGLQIRILKFLPDPVGS